MHDAGAAQFVGGGFGGGVGPAVEAGGFVGAHLEENAVDDDFGTARATADARMLQRTVVLRQRQLVDDDGGVEQGGGVELGHRVDGLVQPIAPGVEPPLKGLIERILARTGGCARGDAHSVGGLRRGRSLVLAIAKHLLQPYTLDPAHRLPAHLRRQHRFIVHGAALPAGPALGRGTR